MVDKEAYQHGGTLLNCLAVLCNYHQLELSREAVIAGLPLENGELSPSTFDRAARRVGLSSQISKAQLHQINTALLPAVLLLKGNKACVVTKLNLKEQTITLVYPELTDSEVTQGLAEFQQAYSNTLIYARPEFRFDARSPALGQRTEQHWFWSAIRECRKLYRDVIFSALAIGILSVAMPLFVMNVYDRVVPNQAEETLWVLAVGVFTALTADFILRLVRAYFVELAASRIDVKVSSRILERILGMQLINRPQAVGAFAGNVQAFEAVRSFFSSFTLIALVDLPFIALYLLIIGIINPWLILPILAGILLLLGYALSAHIRLEQLSEQSMKASSMRNAVLVEGLNNLDEIKAFQGESKIQATWEKCTLFLARINSQSRLTSSSISSAALWVQQAVGISLIVVGVYAVFRGDLSQGGLIAAYLLSSRAMAPIGQSAALLAQYHQAAIAMESLNEIMDKPPERPPTKEWIDHPVLHGDIEFRRMWFRYTDETPFVLEDINLKLKAGERVALVGKNGSGKTTLEKLLLALYHPSQGSVLVDNIELGQIDPAQLRHNIGYVPQDIKLFYGTLKENIAFSAWHASDEQVIRAANLAGLLPLITNHPDGLEMQVGEGGKQLSGGQKQAVALARALINDPPVLVFDEPTTALDHVSEIQVINNLKKLLGKKTLLLITHRTSLLELVDRVVVLDEGKIVKDGPKKDILGSFEQSEAQRAS